MTNESFKGEFLTDERIMIDVRINTDDFQRQLDELSGILQSGIQKMGVESSKSFNDNFKGAINLAGMFNTIDIAFLKFNDLYEQIKGLDKAAISGFGAMTAALGPVVPALAGAAATLGFLMFLQSNYNDAVSESGRLVQSLEDKQRALADSFTQSESAFSGRIESMGITSEVANTLADDIFNLYEKENLSAGEAELMRLKIEELNSIVPDLGLVFDENTEKLTLNTGAIIEQRDALTEQIDKQMQLMKVEAYRERQTELMKELVAAEEAAAEAALKRGEAQQILDEWLEKANVDTPSYAAKLGLLEGAVRQAADAEAEFKNTAKEKEDAILALSGKINDSADAVKQANADKSQSEQAAAKAAEKSSERQIAAYDNSAVEAQRAADAAGKSVQEMNSLSPKAEEAGSNAGEGLGVGMLSKESWLITIAKGLVSSIFLAMKSVAIINSPSKVTMGYGAYMAEGLALGMAENEKLINRAAENLISSLFDTMESASERRLADEILTIDRIIEEEKRLAKETARLKDIASKEDAVRTAKNAEDKIEAEIKLAETLRKYEIEDLEARRKMLSVELEAFGEARNERVKVLEDAVYREREINTQYYDEEANKAIELTNVKIQLFDEEYIAKVRAIDAELAAFLEMNNRQIEEIISRIEMEDEESAKRLRDIQERKIKLQELSEAEKAAREQKAKDEKGMELLNRIWEAETMEKQMKASEEYNKWRESEDYKMREKARGEEIKRLDEQFKAEVENQKKINEAKLAEIEKLNEESKARIGLSVETITNGGIDLEKEKEAQTASLTQKGMYFADDSKMTEKHYEQTLEATQDHQSKVYEVTSEYYRQKQEALVGSQAAEYSLIDMFNRNVINLLYSFTPSWYQAGVSFMDNLIAGLQSRLSDLNALVSQIQSAMNSVSGGYSDYDVPFYGTGGVVTSPRLAVVGDVPEAIIPLNRLNSIITSATTIALPYYAARADDGNQARGASYGNSENVKKEITINNTYNINQPVKSPAETARAIKEISKRLAEGL